MDQRRCCAWLAVLCLATGVARGQTATVVARGQAAGLSFERAQILAIERAPMLAARQAAVDAAQQLRTSAAQLPDPKLSVGIDNLPIGGPERFTIGREPMTQRSIGWMQDVPNRDKRAARAAGAQARSERERALMDVERLAVQREVAQAWLVRYFAERRLAQFQALDDESRLLRETVNSRIASGKAMPAEATMARQDALMLADRRDELVRERAQALASLQRWLGDEGAAPLAGAPPLPTLQANALQEGIARHADVRVFAPMQGMATSEVQELEAAKKGDWNWQLSYGRRGSGFGDMVSFQLSFELPLWAGERQDPQIAAKRKELQRLEAEREDLLRRRREEVDQQLAELDELVRKSERLRSAAVPLAQERIALAMAAYESARGDLGAVLTARRERAELALRDEELQARAWAVRAKLNYLTTEPR